MCIDIKWDGERVHFEGHTPNAQIPTKLGEYLYSKFCTEEAEELFEQNFGDHPFEIFGEGYGAKIQDKGELYTADNSIAIFDARYAESRYWLDREDVYHLADLFDCSHVPVISNNGTLAEAIGFIKLHPCSVINKTHEMEGLIGRPKVELYEGDERIIVKVKYRDFKDVDFTENTTGFKEFNITDYDFY